MKRFLLVVLLFFLFTIMPTAHAGAATIPALSVQQAFKCADKAGFGNAGHGGTDMEIIAIEKAENNLHLRCSDFHTLFVKTKKATTFRHFKSFGNGTFLFYINHDYDKDKLSGLVSCQRPPYNNWYIVNTPYPALMELYKAYASEGVKRLKNPHYSSYSKQVQYVFGSQCGEYVQ